MTIQKIYPAIQLFQGKLEEIPIFDGEKHGFRLRFSLHENPWTTAARPLHRIQTIRP